MRYPLFWVVVEGESMLPDLEVGQRYLASGWLTPRTGDAVVADTKDGVVVKWFKRKKENQSILFGSRSDSSVYVVEDSALKGVLLRYRFAKRVISQ